VGLTVREAVWESQPISRNDGPAGHSAAAVVAGLRFSVPVLALIGRCSDRAPGGGVPPV